MTEQNLFKSNDDDNQITLDENKNYYEDYVGEGKKFKDNEALAKAKAYSDIHITNLERRIDQLREDYIKVVNESKSGATLQSLIDQLTQEKQQLTNRQQPPSNEANLPPAIKPEEIESLVSNSIAKYESTRREQDNYNQVLAKVQERFGSNFKTVLMDQAASLGLNEQEVNDMARKNPNLFYKTFDLNAAPTSEPFQAPPSSNVRSNNFAPKTEKRTMSYYENLRKTKPMLYYDPKIAVQMDKDAQALGQAFFDI